MSNGENAVVVPCGTVVQFFDRDRPNWNEARTGIVSGGPFAGGKYEVAVFDRVMDQEPRGVRIEVGVMMFPHGSAVLDAKKWAMYEPGRAKFGAGAFGDIGPRKTK